MRVSYFSVTVCHDQLADINNTSDIFAIIVHAANHAIELITQSF